MSMFRIAQFLQINQAVEGVGRGGAAMTLPSGGYVARYTPWEREDERLSDWSMAELRRTRERMNRSSGTGVLFV